MHLNSWRPYALLPCHDLRVKIVVIVIVILGLLYYDVGILIPKHLLDIVPTCQDRSTAGLYAVMIFV